MRSHRANSICGFDVPSMALRHVHQHHVLAVTRARLPVMRRQNDIIAATPAGTPTAALQTRARCRRQTSQPPAPVAAADAHVNRDAWIARAPGAGRQSVRARCPGRCAAQPRCCLDCRLGVCASPALHQHAARPLIKHLCGPFDVVPVHGDVVCDGGERRVVERLKCVEGRGIGVFAAVAAELHWSHK